MADISVRFDVPVKTGGLPGWGPELAVVSDGARRVLQVVDWVGGDGAKPEVGQYVGPLGLVSAAADAVDIRGSAGAAGSPGAAGTNGTGTLSATVTFCPLGGPGTTLQMASSAGVVTQFQPTDEGVFVTTFKPAKFRMTFTHLGGGATSGCSVGFQVSGDGSTWTTGYVTPISLSTLGVFTVESTLTLSGSGPWYFRAAYSNNEALSGGDESFIVNLWTLTLVAEGVVSEGGGSGSTASPVGYTLATLRARTEHTEKQVAKLLWLTSAGDGGAGDFWYDTTSSASDDGIDTIKPTDVSGAGRWRRLIL